MKDSSETGEEPEVDDGYVTLVNAKRNPDGSLTETTERTQKEVADILGISQSYISRLEKKIMGRLKKEMNKLM